MTEFNSSTPPAIPELPPEATPSRFDRVMAETWADVRIGMAAVVRPRLMATIIKDAFSTLKS